MSIEDARDDDDELLRKKPATVWSLWRVFYHDVWLGLLLRTRTRVALCSTLCMLLVYAVFLRRPASYAHPAAVFRMSAAHGDGHELFVDRDGHLQRLDGDELRYSERLAMYARAELTAVNASELSNFLRFFNDHSPWINVERFELERDFVPIVMRANRRNSHVQTVLQRLARVERINRTVLIVSHDSLDLEMIETISKIRFMVVRQIVNPQSANILLSRFPGTDELAGAVRDKFGNGRADGKHPGIKLHFMWHLSYVWRSMLPAHVSDILLVEEDHVPTFDFYIAARSLISVADSLCDECEGVLVGHHTKEGRAQTLDGTTIGKPFGVGAWGSNTNLGLSMSRMMWRTLLDSALVWCSFDDYNWDLSLEMLRAKKTIAPFLLSMRWSRLFHFGLCGGMHGWRPGHYERHSCDDAEAKLLDMIDRTIEPTLKQEYAARRAVLLRNATFVAAREAARKAALINQRYTHRFSRDADPRDVFWYVDDADGIAGDYFPALANGLWARDELRKVMPHTQMGWGGFGRLDQEQCVRVAGIGEQLLSPLLASKAVRNAAPVGCFVDKKRHRDLGMFHGLVQRRADCFTRCRKARLPFAGIQFGSECWCGLSYGLHARVNASECFMKCSEPSGADDCGAPDRNSVFDLRE
jgi:hypothetical protein